MIYSGNIWYETDHHGVVDIKETEYSNEQEQILRM
jgi:hypothetical protein